MRYENVSIASIGYVLPDEVVTTAEIKARLTPLYQRLGLPEGRLELMTGIAQRRFWPVGTRPSEMSIASAQQAIQASGLPAGEIGVLVHGSVCRDFLEPATACGVHHRLGLPDDCLVYDLSNACLGLLNGVVHVANMIELGQIRAGVVVGTESGRNLVEATIDQLNRDMGLTRRDIKPALASLTIGSASAAIVLADRRLSPRGHRLRGVLARTNTRQAHLCQGGSDGSTDEQGRPLMATDSEMLLQEGVATARGAFADFLTAMEWQAGEINKTICHQVGRAHQKLLLETLGLDPAIDFTSYQHLGNTGSTALPVTAALAAEHGHLRPGDRVAFLGIGSGINVLMLALEWGG
jgi:acyl-CoA:acyl-CoA alkyltransferase